MSDLLEIRQEAEDALAHVWFIASLEEVERTDITLSLRLHIRRDLFVQVFSGVTSGSLYMALIEGGRRVFGMDRESGEWHVHPYEAVERHASLSKGLDPQPLLKFLARVEELLLEHGML